MAHLTAMSATFPPTAMSPAELVGRLADPHRYFVAYQRLLSLGPAATPAAEDGLRHPSPQVRELCCKLLDHIAGPASFAALIAAMDDPAPEVRIQAIHALACDRCKSDSCRADAASVVPSALRLLTDDPSPKVRGYAVELVGAWVHSQPECVEALTTAADSDPSPAVRKKAAWYAPGGVIFQRTQPKPHANRRRRQSGRSVAVS